MKAINIKWDIDFEDEVIETWLIRALPIEIEIPKGMKDEDDIADYLSNITGYCHDGFELVFNMKKEDMKSKIKLYVTESLQRLEIFADMEICSEEDNDMAHDLMDKRLEEMTNIELENMCNRIDSEDDYDNYYQIIG